MFDSLGPMELGIILLIVVMIFGVGKLPEIASSLGKAIKEFKRSSSSADSTESETAETAPRKKIRRATKKPAVLAAIESGSAITAPALKTESVKSVEVPLQSA